VAVFTTPRTLEPGAEEVWTTTLVTGPVTPVVDSIAAELGPWRWADPGVADTCPVA
jgi:hypothetical protein